jgi:hypothetical protein
MNKNDLLICVVSIQIQFFYYTSASLKNKTYKHQLTKTQGK